MTLTEILNSGPAIGAAVTAVFAALYKGTRAILEFHDEYLRKRRFKYLSYLIVESEAHADLSEFIESAKRESLFSAVFGRAAPPRVALAIMALYESKFFSLSELRASFFYMKINDVGVLDVSPGKKGMFIATLVSAFLMFMVFYVWMLVQQLLILSSPAALVTAMFIVLFFLGYGLMLARDVLEVIIARRVGDRIRAYRAGNLSLPSNERPAERGLPPRP
ncbi:hypothetical protein [Candidatus Methylobacter oryzae]|uniref:Type II secretion system protein GspF domain-containing protein n=1 Tax=Candidatus Methylobacter oryzae TaxID=2497749 RepID=A0ABY3C5H5_9GAMM|nr:hypothetical protein [Candidatus Methylobacter oryzae]TRW90262.1 hypothetical protein EKO24_019695 [Candidatus Methylobacter oryzae]